MSESLTETELRLLMAVIEEGCRGEPTAGLPWVLLEQLVVLIPSEAISCPEFDLAVSWSDFSTPAQLRETPHYADYRRAEGFRYGIHLAFPASAGIIRKVSLWRGPGRDFSERDRLILQLLRPHLWEIHESRLHRTDLPKLTHRERQVLDLVDAGLGNTEIARELFISVATVRKHLEHIFDRTGVRTRSAAAALMRDH
jgi:DNA-binding CsgD family transcriptional regulator